MATAPRASTTTGGFATLADPGTGAGVPDTGDPGVMGSGRLTAALRQAAGYGSGSHCHTEPTDTCAS